MSDIKAPKSLFANRRFTQLWASIELSFLGAFIHVVAGGWLMTSMTESATLVALTQTANALPLVFFSILAGALADTFDKRRTMIAALGISVAGSVLLAGAGFAGLLTPWLMLALIFTVGVGVAIFTPSWQASLGALVERDQLTEAVSMHNMGANLMRTIGPTLGGVLVTLAGAPVAFLVGAFSYVPAMLTLSFWMPKDGEGITERESVPAAMASGVRFLLASPNLSPILVRVFCFSTSAISIMALLPLVARDQLGGGAAEYGFLFGGFGLGAILGGLVLRPLRKRQNNEWIVRRAFLVNTLAIVALAASPNFGFAMVATIVAGGCWLSVHSLQNTTLQLATPRWIVGRMVSMFLTAAFLGLSIGSWIWGLVAQFAGTELSLCASAATMAGTYLLALRFPLPETRNLILEPLPELSIAGTEPAEGRNVGPVQIMVEHRVDPEKRTEFRRLMFLRRRHLTRLGARHWALLHDLERDSLWIETFRLATWSDYERFMGRRTAETVNLRESICAVQIGGQDPVLHRTLVANPGPDESTIMVRT